MGMGEGTWKEGKTEELEGGLRYFAASTPSLSRILSSRDKMIFGFNTRVKPSPTKRESGFLQTWSTAGSGP